MEMSEVAFVIFQRFRWLYQSQGLWNFQEVRNGDPDSHATVDEQMFRVGRTARVASPRENRRRGGVGRGAGRGRRLAVSRLSTLHENRTDLASRKGEIERQAATG
jgi:hypothetical protein